MNRYGDASAYRPELGPCWIWTAYIRPDGYGSFVTDTRAISHEVSLAHRFSYELHFGPIPDGFDIDHLCRVRSCVNPAHLEAVTHAVNCRRGIAGAVNGDRQRAKTHCPRGHEYNQENTYISRKSARECRRCRRGAKRASRKKRSETVG
ncbi:MAG: hypothetical protein CMK98_13615 [Pseudomonas sp.]|nr:hypothetical protein [Pseudomonas sp.]